ncbi:hypothetical protein EON82_14085 [bacterium]|nr:MAG: hypothetical protein EON82_14085 [bacterium]
MKTLKVSLAVLLVASIASSAFAQGSHKSGGHETSGRVSESHGRHAGSKHLTIVEDEGHGNPGGHTKRFIVKSLHGKKGHSVGNGRIIV